MFALGLTYRRIYSRRWLDGGDQGAHIEPVLSLVEGCAYPIPVIYIFECAQSVKGIG